MNSYGNPIMNQGYPPNDNYDDDESAIEKQSLWADIRMFFGFVLFLMLLPFLSIYWFFRVFFE